MKHDLPPDDFDSKGMWVLLVIFGIPWLVGLGAIFNWLLDDVLW